MTTFSLWGKQFEYFNHLYNCTWLNERCVELPVAFDFRDGRSDNGLEVGNVMAHYGVTGHRVVDRYEVAPGVENLDVFDVQGSFDWIVAISTLEHVRWDEDPVDVSGTMRAVDHLRSLLAPGGEMLVTMPTGSHDGVDTAIAEGTTGAFRSATLSRSTEDPRVWIQDPVVRVSPYGERTDWAETVWIGEFK